MKKNQFIVLVIIIILILAVVIGFTVFQIKKLGKENALQDSTTEQEEILSILGAVSSVNAGENFLIVKPNEGEEVKVILSETTKIIKMDSSGRQAEIKIASLKNGDKILVKSKENIAGKTEFNKIDYIQVLP